MDKAIQERLLACLEKVTTSNQGGMSLMEGLCVAMADKNLEYPIGSSLSEIAQSNIRIADALEQVSLSLDGIADAIQAKHE